MLTSAHPPTQHPPPRPRSGLGLQPTGRSAGRSLNSTSTDPPRTLASGSSQPAFVTHPIAKPPDTFLSSLCHPLLSPLRAARSCTNQPHPLLHLPPRANERNLDSSPLYSAFPCFSQQGLPRSKASTQPAKALPRSAREITRPSHL